MVRLGIPAAARASLYVYNTKEDIDRLVEGIEKAKSIFGK
jgi:cysteine desulfurase/selenocysteine lyase